MRFTQEQIQISNALKTMIEFYYVLKPLKEKDRYSLAAIRKLTSFLGSAIPNFLPCLCFPQFHFFYYRFYPPRDASNRIDDRTTYDFHVLTISDFTEFIQIMEAVEEDRKNDVTDFFSFTECSYDDFWHVFRSKSVQYLMPLYRLTEKMKDRNDIIVLDGEGIIEYGGKPKTKIKGDSIQQFAFKYCRNLNITLADFTDRDKYFESFDYNGNRESAVSRHFAETKVSDYKPTTTPGYKKQISDLSEATKFLLVKYGFLFGSFDRIKICKNCGKLFFEKKKGAGTFCGDGCRLHRHIELEDPKKHSCRNRQNRWLGRRFSTPDYVGKDECESCSEWKTQSGSCPILTKKNENLLKSRL